MVANVYEEFIMLFQKIGITFLVCEGEAFGL